ncbi:MAG TPA: hypothetical protein VGF17_09770, partial [Phytomonospora sp.]
MTGRDERGALHVRSIRTLLADYLAAHRGGPFAFKPPSGARSEKVPFDERPGHIRAAIERFRTTVPRPSIASLDARLTEIGFPGRSWVDAEQEFDGDDAELADIGRRLAHDAADSVPLLVGLALMRGRADRRDIGDLGILAMHPYEPGRSAIAILAGLPGSTGELRRLASIPGDEVIRIRAVSALCDRPEAVPWLLRNGLTGPDDWSGNALRVAAAVDL